jgi:hypothetical protein
MARLLLASLLLVSMITPMLTPQSAPYQTASTSTSLVTSTTTGYATTVFTTETPEPLRLGAPPPTLNRQTNSFVLDQEKVRFIGHFHPFRTLPPLDEIDVITCQYYEFFVYDAQASQDVSLHFDAPNVISFYIMKPRLLDYVDNYACSYGSWPALVRVVAASADLNWTAPQSGQYAFVFAARKPLPVHFTAYSMSAAVQTTTQTYATTTTYAVQNLIPTPPSQAVGTVASPQSFNGLVTVVAVLAVLILGLVGIVMRRKGKTS